MEICIYLKAYLHKIWWHLNFNFNFEIYFRKLFNEEAFIQGRSRSQNNFIDTSGVIFLCIANEKYFQFETQQRIGLLAIVNWTYCFSILYSPEYQFQFPHSQIHLYCIELCLREEAVVQVLHRGAVSVATITIYIYMYIRLIHLKDSNKSVASYVWLKGFKIVLWIQIYHHSVIITVYKVIENQF